MNEQNLVPRNARCWAIVCYLSGLPFTLSSFIALVSKNKLYGAVNFPKVLEDLWDKLFNLDIVLILEALALFLVLPLLLWLLTKRIHPFVDFAGRNAVNMMLNVVTLSIAIFLLLLFFGAATCGLTILSFPTSSSGRSSGNSPLLYFLIFMVGLFALLFVGIYLTHLVYIIIGAWRARRGETVVLPMMQFIKS
jgi:uncharacterized Tic20 family protein